MQTLERSEQGAALAKQKLEEAVQRNLASVQSGLQRVFTEVPQDSIVRAGALEFVTKPVERVTWAGDGLAMVAGETAWSLHPNALRQVADRAGMPGKYATALDEGEPWQREMLAEVLTTTYQHSDKRHLVRAISGQARGFMSDRYRRLDGRPVAERFLEMAQELGAVPYKASVTDTRVSIKVIVPTPIEVVPGEWVCFGLELHNSDFGCGSLEIRGFLLRCWCLNGSVTENTLRKVHLGGRLDDDLNFSNRTMRLDQATIRSAVGDAVTHTLSPDALHRNVARIQAAAENQTTWAAVEKRLSKVVTKAEMAAAGTAFDSPDVVNLPAGNTLWRASNALSWIAHTTESPERVLELERIAGGLV